MFKDINQINPKYWGKSFWIFLNSLGLVYTPEKKHDYKIFFEKLGNLLPCDLCCKHYNLFLTKLDDALESKDKLIDWLLTIRNDINLKSNKKILDRGDIFTEIYFLNQNNCLNDQYKIKQPKQYWLSKYINLNSKKIILILIIAILSIVYIIKKTKKTKKTKNNRK